MEQRRRIVGKKLQIGVEKPVHLCYFIVSESQKRRNRNISLTEPRGAADFPFDVKILNRRGQESNGKAE